MAWSSGNAFQALAGNGELEQELDALRIADDPKPNSKKLKNALIWIDLEMTGLDVNKDSILQIAVVITDGQLQSKVVGPELTIHHSDEVLANMNEWCIEHHGKSGLTDKVRESTVDMASAEAEVMEFIEKYAEEGTQIAGNSVHVDVQFLKRLMPRITDYCHYRIVDVSSVGELCRRWVLSREKLGFRFSSFGSWILDLGSWILDLGSRLSTLTRAPPSFVRKVVPEGGRAAAEKGPRAHGDERHPGKYRAAQVLQEGNIQKVIRSYNKHTHLTIDRSIDQSIDTVESRTCRKVEPLFPLVIRIESSK